MLKQIRRISFFTGAQRRHLACCQQTKPSVPLRRLQHSFTVMYGKTGAPKDVLTSKDVPIPSLNPSEVLVKMVASPILPSDINLIEGNYGTNAALPAIPGNEGVGIVETIGEDVKDLQAGDHVLPLEMHLGTWRTHLVVPHTHLLKINKNIPLLDAATMNVNPCTAFRMLKDFGAKPGDTVIQNGANSAVGQALIQIGKKLGFKTVNIIRAREDFKSLSEYLYTIGADVVLSDEDLRKPEAKEIWKKFEKPTLAIDCVAGKSATELLRHLARYGTLVNYGGMSRQPITAPVSALIFKEICIRGFWFSEWRNRNPVSDAKSMIHEVGEMYINNDLKAPLSELTDIHQFDEAVGKAMTPYTSKKQILVMDERVYK